MFWKLCYLGSHSHRTLEVDEDAEDYRRCLGSNVGGRLVRLPIQESEMDGVSHETLQHPPPVSHLTTELSPNLPGGDALNPNYRVRINSFNESMRSLIMEWEYLLLQRRSAHI